MVVYVVDTPQAAGNVPKEIQEQSSGTVVAVRGRIT
jgi:hypothetical protein